MTLHRSAGLEAGTGTETEAGIVRLSFASEAAVLREDPELGRYYEVLSHAPGDAVLGFLNQSGVLLEGHDERKVLGGVVSGSARVEGDRKTRARVRVNDPAWRTRIAAGNPPKGVSVGYVHLSELSRSNDAIPTIRFSWKPYEVSFLADDHPAADPTVGINRSKPAMHTQSTIDRLLDLAISGSRHTEGKFTREQQREEFSVTQLLRGEAAGLTREIASSASYLGRQAMGGYFLPFNALLPRQRDLTATGGLGAGGALVGTETHPAIELLRNKVAAVPLGARVITGLRDNFAAPVITNALAPASLAETAGAVLQQFTLDQRGLAPCRATVQLSVSEQLLRQADDAEDVIRTQIADAIGVRVDYLVLNGQGAMSEPLGIMNTVGIGSVIYGGAASWPQILASESNLGSSNADIGRLGWAVSPSTRNRWKQIPRIAGSTTPIFVMADDQAVNGYPSVSTNQLSGTHQSVFGNWSDVWILVWGDGIDFVVDRFTQSPAGKVIVTAHLWFNILVRHPQSFCVSADPANQ